MDIIGRIGTTVFLNLSAPRIITECRLEDESDLEYIDDYSSMYYIELAVYGESQFYVTPPITEADHKILAKIARIEQR